MSAMNIRKKSTSGAASLVKKHPRQHIVRRVLVILLALLLLVAVVIGGIGVYFSNAILEVIHYTPVYNLAVTAVSAKTMTLQRTSDTLTPGEFPTHLDRKRFATGRKNQRL